MADFERNAQLFDVRGICLSKPVDRLAPNEYRLLDNVRPYGEGRLQGRQGITLVSLSGTTGDPAHSVFSFEDPIPSPTQFPGAFIRRVRLLGSGTELLAARDATDPVAFAPVTYNPDGYSGRPMTFAVASSQYSQRPWAFVGDFNKLVKVNSAVQAWQTGVAPPNFAPTIALGAVNPDGPNVGDSPNPYIYAFRARTDPLVVTGAVSNLGPAVRMVNGLSPAGQNIEITLPQAHPDPQVGYIDVFRWGGSLPVWLYIGTTPNIAANVITDSFPDSAIANGQQAELNDNQPFLSVDIGQQGTATITALGPGLGALMTITAGDLLRPYDAAGTDPYYLAGNQVSIGGQLFTFYRSPDTTTTVELLEDPVGAPFSDFFLIPNPEMARQALPCIWGPFGGGLTGTFIFACGDALRPGAIYWTKGNNPESHPGTNVLDITSGSEPLMNGCLYNGNCYVFSTRRCWSMYPTLGQVSDFSAIEIPNSKGIFARWGICVTPYGICFVSKDGIYLTTGGEPVSLTDRDLYPLFPQESQGDDSGFPEIDGLEGVTFNPPDFDEPDSFRLAYGDGFLYFTYLDTGGVYRTLVYGFEQREPGWVSRDTYTPEVTLQFYENFHDETAGSSWAKVLMGSLDGRVFEIGGNADNEAAIAGHIRTGSYDTGDPRPRKLWGDVELDLDATCDTLDVKAGFDNFSYLSTLSATGTNITGRRRLLSDINAGLGQYAYNLGMDISWSVIDSQPVLYFWTPTHVHKVELTATRVTDWDDAGYPGSKFVQGFTLRADTLNVTRQIAVLSDGGVIQQVFSVLHPNEQEVTYWFTTPFISSLLRLAPQDAQFWRMLGVTWIWEPSPNLAAVWTTQNTTHDLPGYFSHRDFLPALISFNDPVILTCTINGDANSPYSYTIPAGLGLYRKFYLPLQPMKGREVQYSLTSICPFRLFLKDCEVRVKAWGQGGPYVSKRPFGDISREIGARI